MMPGERTLRSNFAEGTLPWAARRAHWRALGLTDEDLERPKIAIVNSSSELALCFSHLDEIAKRLKEAIRAAGALAFEVRTAAPSDFITSVGQTGGYIQSSRDLIACDIEVSVEGARLDGMVCLASCDKTVPGQLMAAGRLNIPTLVVPCGYQPSGRYRGEHMDIEDVFMHVGHHAAGRTSLAELREMTETAILGPGVCPGMGTANSMHIVAEALGMTLPGSAPVLANSAKMWQAVRLAGERIVQMVWDDIKPRDVLTPGAFANAVMVMLAVSGSINTVKHLQGIASEARCKVDVYELFERHAASIPLLTAVRPNGDHLIEELEAAGGARAVMKQLEGVLDLGVRTVMGRTVGETLRDVTVVDEEVVRPVDRPFSTRPSIILVRGSLAPAYGIIKLAVTDDRPMRFEGPAVIYESRELAIEGIKNGAVKPGQVLVLRGFGLKGNPGMGLLSSCVFALDGAGLSGSVAVVTDGHVSGLLNKNLLVGEISPEAAEGGPLALVEPGDMILIDVHERVVDLKVAESELAVRRARLVGRPEKEVHGWLSVYRRTVGPMHEGAVLGE